MSPELIGKEGIVVEAKNIQGIQRYALHGIIGKSAWYLLGQLELVNKNPT